MTNLFDLTGKKAVVVGGAGGIGQAIAEGLAEAGAKVMISSRKEESLKRAVNEIKENCGSEILYHVADASVEKDVEGLVQAAVTEMGTVDILVNSQGFNKKFPGTEFPEEMWNAMFDANVKSIMLTKAYASDLRPNIQVNAIGPTITYTPMMVGLLPDSEEERNNIAAGMPAQRIGTPEDCKGPAIFLASAASDFVTGSTIYPDGGLTAIG